METDNSVSQETFDTGKLLKLGRVGGIFLGIALMLLAVGAIIMTIGTLLEASSSGISISGYEYGEMITFDIGAIVLILISIKIIQMAKAEKLPEGYFSSALFAFLFFFFIAISEIIFYVNSITNNSGVTTPSGFIYSPIELIIGAVFILVAAITARSKTMEGRITTLILGIIGIILIFIAYLFNPVSAEGISAFYSTSQANFIGFLFYPAYLIYFFGIFGSYSPLALVSFLVLAVGILITFFLKKGKESIMSLFAVIAAMIFSVGLLITGIVTSTGKYFTDFNLAKYAMPSNSYVGVVNGAQIVLLISGILLLVAGILLIVYTIVKLVEVAKRVEKDFKTVS